MFDDNNKPASPADEPQLNTPSQKPITPHTAVPPPIKQAAEKEKSSFAKAAGDQGPEDIFSQSLPADSSAGKPGEPGEPVSPFIKKEAVAESEPVIPSPPQVSDNKKKLLLFILIAVIIAGLVSAAVWWFARRTSSQNEINPAVIDLFTEPSGQEQPVANAPEPQSPEVTSPVDADADGDGLSDQEEAALGTSINSPDTDNDGLYDREEVKVYGTDPLKSDTDGDGWKDGQEVQKKQDPLSPDPPPQPENYFQSSQYKFSFIYPPEMVLESSANNIVQFNDNFNQIKLYIYINNSQPIFPAPDISYTIGQQGNKLTIIKSTQNKQDDTPYSTQFATQSYTASNGQNYLIRYLATQRADNHQEKFANILTSFTFQ